MSFQIRAVKSQAPAAETLDKLVLVAGHAVYLGKSPEVAASDTAWDLQSFQKGDPPYYIAHVRFGVELAAAHPKSLLVFSGGQTRLPAGPTSEAQGYLSLAQQFGWWQRAEVSRRTTTEDFARDSFENLLFGIARFREHTGRYPESIEVISWAFKLERFDLHRRTIGWPDGKQRYQYHSMDNPVDVDGALKCESQTFAAFDRDPFGSEPPLRHKREQRNPFHRIAPYPVTCPEITELLTHQTAAGKAFPGILPWSPQSALASCNGYRD